MEVKNTIINKTKLADKSARYYEVEFLEGHPYFNKAPQGNIVFVSIAGDEKRGFKKIIDDMYKDLI